MKKIKLQGIYGMLEAKMVKDLVVGDVITWNYGYQSKVIELIPSKSGKTVNLILQSLSDGIIRNRAMRASSLVVA